MIKLNDIMKGRKDYKQRFLEINRMKKGMNNKGQLAVFIIIALVIIGIVLVIFFYPSARNIISGQEINPEKYLKECVQGDIKKDVDGLAKYAGYREPEGFTLYDGNKVKYLCYVTGYYKTCVVQQPMIQAHFEQELNNMLREKTKACLGNLGEAYRSRGYSVSSGESSSNVEIIPGKIKVTFVVPMTISKAGEDPRTYDKFEAEIDSQMYDLVSIAQSIVEFESTLGDSETVLYMQYYPDLRIEKIKLTEGTKIYKLENVITKEKFVFASRSLSWPPGYALQQTAREI